jgi:predicted enzyme related to lactoylglutathione lyase
MSSPGDEHGPQVGPVMVFTALRGTVSSFYEEVLGLSGDEKGDEIWLDAANAKVVVKQTGAAQTPKEVAEQQGFVVWFGVADVRGAYEKARRRGAAASDFFGDYFFSRDPDGRFVGVYALEDHAHGHDHEH